MAFENPTALITGATSRIGYALASDLAEQGWNIVGHTRSADERASELKREIESRGGKICILQADLTNPEELLSLFEKATEAFGCPNILINNASIFEDDGIGRLAIQQFDAHFQIHARAPVFLADQMAARLAEDEQGLIINMIDQRVWKLTPQALSYSLSKSTLWTATQTLAQALAPRIRVNAIGPGPSFKGPRQTQDDFDRQTSSVPLGRGPEPGEFAQTVRYLWEAKSITGQMIALDGGQHLAWQTPDVMNVGE